jgi:hypothetical protein
MELSDACSNKACECRKRLVGEGAGPLHECSWQDIGMGIDKAIELLTRKAMLSGSFGLAKDGLTAIVVDNTPPQGGAGGQFAKWHPHRRRGEAFRYFYHHVGEMIGKVLFSDTSRSYVSTERFNDVLEFVASWKSFVLVDQPTLDPSHPLWHLAYTMPNELYSRRMTHRFEENIDQGQALARWQMLCEVAMEDIPLAPAGIHQLSQADLHRAFGRFKDMSPHAIVWLEMEDRSLAVPLWRYLCSRNCEGGAGPLSSSLAEFGSKNGWNVMYTRWGSNYQDSERVVLERLERRGVRVFSSRDLSPTSEG